MVKFPSLHRFQRRTSTAPHESHCAQVSRSVRPWPVFVALELLIACLCCSLSWGQPTPRPAETLHIAAASDLQPVLPPILKRFERETGIHPEATYQASAALTAQIQNGAPFDIFLSANLSYPKWLIYAGLADTRGIDGAQSGAPVIYARGALVLWTRNDSHWPHPSLVTLRDPALRRLAIANPERAPYGRAAMATLTSLKLLDLLKPKLVTAENIAQTAQFAETGNADAGLISMTSAQTPHLQAIGTAFVIPKDLYPPIEQGAAILSKTSARVSAEKFLNYLLSPPIQKELAQSGLAPVK
ncbi:MAG TPA: molybdate ABC transporter substrate-binding protein [Acidobacteriaceae bacterium]|nr:molybdate ABC transporter substrate-binding protein [Acidobacteriaceae bacterium]